jgi:polar amino acid transport system substrate-binding protein
MHKAIFILCLFLLAGCGNPSSGYNAKVALDPTWQTLEIPGRENNVTVFSLELLEAIGAKEKISIGVYEKSWDNLMLGLQSGDYTAICTSMEPYLFYEKTYIFSDVYLTTGPVLVTSVHASWSSLEELNGREVAILHTPLSLLEKYPNIIQRPYDSVQQAFDDIKDGLIDAALVNRLTAEAFVQDLYSGQLKISSPPLTPEGLRLMGLTKNSKKFIETFNKGLSLLKADGTYQKISQKWGLSEPSS